MAKKKVFVWIGEGVVKKENLSNRKSDRESDRKSNRKSNRKSGGSNGSF